MAETLQSSLRSPTLDNVTHRYIGLSAPTMGPIPTGAHPCQGLYWTMKENRYPSTAVLFVHYNADFTEHYLAGPLAARGLGVLGYNTRFRGQEDMFILEKALEDIAVATKWLRNEAKAKKIVLIGNSGGGSLLAAFQAKAQSDPSVVAGDAFIFLNAHPGRPDVLTKWLDPSVVDETDPVKTDPSLNIYDPSNKPPFSKEFLDRYRAAQVARNDRITDWAIKELERLNATGIPDRLFPLYRTMADPRFIDATIEPSERPANNCYSGNPEQANRGVGLLGRVNTLQTWLSMWSLQKSKCRLEPYTAVFTVPTLVIQGTADAGVFPSDAKRIFDSIKVEDKELRMIPGSHFFDRSQEERDAVTNLVFDWISKKV